MSQTKKRKKIKSGYSCKLQKKGPKPKGQRYFSCRTCEIIFDTPEELKTHSLEHQVKTRYSTNKSPCLPGDMELAKLFHASLVEGEVRRPEGFYLVCHNWGCWYISCSNAGMYGHLQQCRDLLDLPLSPILVSPQPISPCK